MGRTAGLFLELVYSQCIDIFAVDVSGTAGLFLGASQLTHYFSVPVNSLCINIFAADVGGTAGLFLGASLLTVMEFGEFFLLVTISVLKGLSATTELEQKYSKDTNSSEENIDSVDKQKTSGFDYYSPEYGFSQNDVSKGKS